MRGEPLFTLILIGQIKTQNKRITELQQSLLKKYREDMKLFKIFDEKDLAQIVKDATTRKIYCVLDHHIDNNNELIFENINKGLNSKP